GRHEGLKILWPLPAVWVRVPLTAPYQGADNKRLSAPFIYWNRPTKRDTYNRKENKAQRNEIFRLKALVFS
ncbi:MAG: hypothetical protein K2M67_09700, partial [Muribaculaceae bacterium]|nr:hypothetical protein [Muribaculaceae bacterium]